MICIFSFITICIIEIVIHNNTQHITDAPIRSARIIALVIAVNMNLCVITWTIATTERNGRYIRLDIPVGVSLTHWALGNLNEILSM